MSELTEELARLRKAIDLKPLVTTCPKCGRKVQIAPSGPTWFCWSCMDGGDVFAYLMKRDGVPFAQAVDVARGMAKEQT